jgi:hypothetical protein
LPGEYINWGTLQFCCHNVQVLKRILIFVSGPIAVGVLGPEED